MKEELLRLKSKPFRSIVVGGSTSPVVLQNNDFNKLTEMLPRFLEEANKNPISRE
jgi:hypothetical protein